MGLEQQYYREKGQSAVINAGNPRLMAPAQICDLASDAAVKADRSRMAEMLRARVLHGSVGVDIPPEIAMRLDDIMFQLADQIEQGMTPTAGDNDG